MSSTRRVDEDVCVALIGQAACGLTSIRRVALSVDEGSRRKLSSVRAYESKDVTLEDESDLRKLLAVGDQAGGLKKSQKNLGRPVKDLFH